MGRLDGERSHVTLRRWLEISETARPICLKLWRQSLWALMTWIEQDPARADQTMVLSIWNSDMLQLDTGK